MKRVIFTALLSSVAGRLAQFLSNAFISNMFGGEFFRVWQTVLNTFLALHQFSTLGLNLVIARAVGPVNHLREAVAAACLCSLSFGAVVVLLRPDLFFVRSESGRWLIIAAWTTYTLYALYLACLLRGQNFKLYSVLGNLPYLIFVLIPPLLYWSGGALVTVSWMMFAFTAVCAFTCAVRIRQPAAEFDWRLPRLAGVVKVFALAPEGVFAILPNLVFAAQIAVVLQYTAHADPSVNEKLSYTVPLLSIYAMIPNSLANIILSRRGADGTPLGFIVGISAALGIVMWLVGYDVVLYIMDYDWSVSKLEAFLISATGTAMVGGRVLIAELMRLRRMLFSNLIAAGSLCFTLAMLAHVFPMSWPSLISAICLANVLVVVCSLAVFAWSSMVRTV